MVEVDTVKLEDGKTYMIIEEKEGYVYLANVENPKEFCIKKQTIENGETFLNPIEDFHEFETALKLFQN